MHSTAEFTLAHQDFTRLQRTMQRRFSKRLRGLWIVQVAKIGVWLLIASAIFMFFKLHQQFPEERAAFDATGAILAVLFLVTLVLPYVRQAFYRKELISPRGSFMMPHRLEFSEASLVVSAAASRSEIAWSCFLARDADDVNHYLFVDACSALVVPRSAIAGFEADFDRYVGKIA